MTMTEATHTRIMVRRPKGVIHQSCTACKRYFGSSTWQQARGQNQEEVVFVGHYLSDGTTWLRTEVFHRSCYTGEVPDGED
jgi:hypothetical protein